MSRPLAAAGIFPARTIHLLQLGEEAAQLAAMSLKAADIHEEQARLMMQRLVALAVPLITIAMGLDRRRHHQRAVDGDAEPQ